MIQHSLFLQAAYLYPSLSGSAAIWLLGKQWRLSLFFLWLRRAVLGREGDSQTRVRGIRVNLSLVCCCIPLPLGSLILMRFGGPRFLRKLSSSSDKFCWVGLTLWMWIGLWGGGLLLLGFFTACFIGRRRKTLITFFGIASMRLLCGVCFCKSLVLAMLVIGVFVRRLRSYSSIRPSGRGFSFLFF